jgi:hypothetical protein
MPKKVEEATIIINGQLLDSGQAMAMRVALESFFMDICQGSLGDDEHGIELSRLYKDRIREVRKMIFR